MPEYIEREALIKFACNQTCGRSPDKPVVHCHNCYMVDVLEEAPAADVVAVVRCKDCKHFADAYGKDSGKPCGYGRCKSISGVRWIVCADDYCSSGERRGEDG